MSEAQHIPEEARLDASGLHSEAGRGIIADEIAFGPFRLIGAERRLLRDGKPVVLGARSLDLLIALTERPGEAVSKHDLMDRVWPGVTVDEGSLRVHIAGLRRALGEGAVQYVATLLGQGYSFVAPLSRTVTNAGHGPTGSVPVPASRLPPASGMVGREAEIAEIAFHLLAYRFVTVLGPGGIGKTTVAVPVARSLADTFGGAVHFVDLGPVSDPTLMPSALAGILGLLVQTSDPLATLTAYLRDKRLLIVLDSCEHVIDAVAGVAEAIYQHAPGVHILATSREVMRVQGEFVYRLHPLDVPPVGVAMTADKALGFAAVQLFVDRVTATQGTFQLTDADAPVVCEICRKLDGIALAIELAAGRVGAYGVQQTAQLLEGQFSLLWQGRRTAPPRHQTLNATLDWSYELLPEPERRMLRRLSAFSGRFSVEAVEAIMAGQADMPVPDEPMLERLASLVGKSMVTADTMGRPAMYRLLDTTRAYAESKLAHNGEQADVARRHATYFAAFLRGLNERSPNPSRAQALGAYADHLGNIRSALEWSFGADGDTDIASRLAAAAARMFLQLSLLAECQLWAGRGIAALDSRTLATGRELELQSCLAQSIMFSKGNSEQVRAAFLRGLVLAEQLGDLRHQLQFLGGLHVFHKRIGDFAAAMRFAQQSLAVAERLGDHDGISAAHSFMGISFHLEGHQADAERHFEAALSLHHAERSIFFGFDHRNGARITLARTLWIRGRFEDAARVAEHALREAAQLEHPVTICTALIWALSINIWNGDWAGAAEGVRQFTEQAEWHSLAPYHAVASGVRGQLDAYTGDPEVGVEALRRALEALQKDRYELLTPAFLCAIGKGQARLGRVTEALATVNGAIVLVEKTGGRLLLPELLRIRGRLLASQPTPDQAAAEACFRHALLVAQGQGAGAWELRAAVSLVHLLAGQGCQDEALGLLATAVSRVDGAADNADIRQARHLLANGCPAAHPPPCHPDRRQDAPHLIGGQPSQRDFRDAAL